MTDGLDEKRGAVHDWLHARALLYNLRVCGNIWSLSLKRDIQSWFVTLT